MTNTENKVTTEHLRRLGYCASGTRHYFAKYKLDYTDFVMNGISPQALREACGEDAMAANAITEAQKDGRR